MDRPCCFRCALESVKARVDTALDCFPVEKWPICRDRLLMPVVRRIALFDPQARMPLSWLDFERSLPGFPCNSDGPYPVTMAIKIRYWEICRLLRTGIVDESMGHIIRTLEKLADSILSLIVKVEHNPNLSQDDYASLWLQVKLIRNEVLNMLIH